MQRDWLYSLTGARPRRPHTWLVMKLYQTAVELQSWNDAIGARAGRVAGWSHPGSQTAPWASC
jgi:hypothetical protein